MDISYLELRELLHEMTEDVRDIPDYFWWMKFKPVYGTFGDHYSQDTECIADELNDIIKSEGMLSGESALVTPRSGNEFDLRHNKPKQRHSSVFDEHWKDLCKELDKELEEL